MNPYREPPLLVREVVETRLVRVRRSVLVLFMLIASLVGGAVASACTPKEREAVAPALAPAIKAGCVLLRALFHDGTTNDICVTAEDLAPLVSEIIAERDERGAAEPAPTGPIVAFAVKEDPRPRLAPKRRCAAWISVETSKDAGAKNHNEAGGGAARGAGDGGH